MDTKTNIFIFIVIGILTIRAIIFRFIDHPTFLQDTKKNVTSYITRCKKGYLIFKESIAKKSGDTKNEKKDQ